MRTQLSVESFDLRDGTVFLTYFITGAASIVVHVSNCIAME